eukprot:3910878-Rhodomonas_salina.4
MWAAGVQIVVQAEEEAHPGEGEGGNPSSVNRETTATNPGDDAVTEADVEAVGRCCWREMGRAGSVIPQRRTMLVTICWQSSECMSMTSAGVGGRAGHSRRFPLAFSLLASTSPLSDLLFCLSLLSQGLGGDGWVPHSKQLLPAIAWTRGGPLDTMQRPAMK